MSNGFLRSGFFSAEKISPTVAKSLDKLAERYGIGRKGREVHDFKGMRREDFTPEQHANRQLLLEAMQAEGFSNYPMEWWHFTHASGTGAEILYDFVIR